MGALTATKVKSLTEPGRYSDGGGLMLHVRAGGAKSWILRTQVDGKRRDIGLGSAKAVPLADARQAAEEIRRKLAQGIDPVAEKKQEKVVIPTFKETAVLVHEEHKAAWKNGKHQAQWLSTLKSYAYPTLGDLLVSEIEGPVIRDVLAKIWLTKPETARRVRQRIGTVLDWAYAKGYRANEAPMRSLSKGLPRQPKKDGHFAAMSFAEVPAFLQILRRRESMGRLALEALILTAARSGEIRMAKWPELDLEAGLWSIPAARMKMGRPHVVPLSPQAVDVFKRAAKLRIPATDVVFYGAKAKKPLSDMTLLKILRDMEAGVTVHGFRSAFRDWVAE
ncbi:MAG TPA: integrase arm-type DNA-binding domain-containing protein [Sphingomicrobium sp.]